MKRIYQICYVLLSVVLLTYLAVPNINFPKPPVDHTSQSKEPADTETTLRRAYFTNFSRLQVVDHYYNQFRLGIKIISIPGLILNYPPEESYTLVRDQTRSTYLQEVVFPLRESVFINGFEPKQEKDAIKINNIDYAQKITIRYYPSDRNTRLIIGLSAVTVGYFVFGMLGSELYRLFNSLKSKIS